MKRTRVSLAKKSGVEQKQNCPIKQPRQTMLTTKPRLAKKHVSGSMVNTQGNKEETTEEKLTRQKSTPITQVEFETPE